MSKGKVKVEITNTYYFTPEQWSMHDKHRELQERPWNDYLERMCLPQHSTVDVDLSKLVDNEGEKGDKKDILHG